MVVKIPRGGVRTRHTAVLRVNDDFEVYLDTFDESNEDDERIGECHHCNESGTYVTDCDNCEDMLFLFYVTIDYKKLIKKQVIIKSSYYLL